MGKFSVTNLFAKYLIISVLLQYPVSYIEICMLKPDNILREQQNNLILN